MAPRRSVSHPVDFTGPDPAPNLSEPPQVQAPAAELGELFGPPVFGNHYDRIVSRIFTVDPFGEYDELERDLKLDVSPERVDYGTLAMALNKGEDNARRAHKLFVNAKLHLAQVEAEVEKLEGTLRMQVVGELAQQKAEGKLSKAATKDDVIAEMSRIFPDEVMRFRTRIAKAKLSVEHLERLSDLWRSRCRTLDTLVSTARR